MLTIYPQECKAMIERNPQISVADEQIIHGYKSHPPGQHSAVKLLIVEREFATPRVTLTGN
jgi:hypothetical protein